VWNLWLVWAREKKLGPHLDLIPGLCSPKGVAIPNTLFLPIPPTYFSKMIREWRENIQCIKAGKYTFIAQMRKKKI
jgi:hypothetical protein